MTPTATFTPTATATATDVLSSADKGQVESRLASQQILAPQGVSGFVANQQASDPGEPGDPGFYICHAEDTTTPTATSPVTDTTETPTAAPPTITGLPSTGSDSSGPGSGTILLMLAAGSAVLLAGAGMIVRNETRSGNQGR
jgi:hypothetical protein